MFTYLLSSRLIALMLLATLCNCSAFLNNDRSDALTELFGCYMTGATWNCYRLGARSVYSIQTMQCRFTRSHIGRLHVCLAVTCYQHFWHNDRDLFRALTVTRGWNGYRNRSQHRKLTLEKRKFSRRSYRDSNPRPFDHETGVPPLSYQLSRFLSVVRSFPALYFDITNMSLTSRTEYQEALSFADRSRKKCLWIAIIFVTNCFYLCGWNFC